MVMQGIVLVVSGLVTRLQSWLLLLCGEKPFLKQGDPPKIPEQFRTNTKTKTI